VAPLPTCKPWQPPARSRRNGPSTGALLVVVLLLGAAGAWLLYRFATTADWEYAEGVVVGLRIDGDAQLFARVEFASFDGQHHRFEGSCPWDTRTGECVGVFYLHGDPSQAKIAHDPFLELGREYLAALGGACVLGCVALLWWLLARRRAPSPRPWDL
jgi:hypothetical protein